MTCTIVTLVVGFLGATIGALTMAACAAGAKADEDRRNQRGPYR